VNLDGGAVGESGDAFDAADLPPVLIEGVDVVVRLELLVEVVGFELAARLPQHSLNEKDLF
jgi:hypothetical protein